MASSARRCNSCSLWLLGCMLCITLAFDAVALYVNETLTLARLRRRGAGHEFALYVCLDLRFVVEEALTRRSTIDGPLYLWLLRRRDAVLALPVPLICSSLICLGMLSRGHAISRPSQRRVQAHYHVVLQCCCCCCVRRWSCFETSWNKTNKVLISMLVLLDGQHDVSYINYLPTH